MVPSDRELLHRPRDAPVPQRLPLPGILSAPVEIAGASPSLRRRASPEMAIASSVNPILTTPSEARSMPQAMVGIRPPPPHQAAARRPKIAWTATRMHGEGQGKVDRTSRAGRGGSGPPVEAGSARHVLPCPRVPNAHPSGVLGFRSRGLPAAADPPRAGRGGGRRQAFPRCRLRAGRAPTAPARGSTRRVSDLSAGARGEHQAGRRPSTHRSCSTFWIAPRRAFRTRRIACRGTSPASTSSRAATIPVRPSPA